MANGDSISGSTISGSAISMNAVSDRITRPVIDTSRPSPARVRDALLGGKDNYAVDRDVVQQLLDVAPGLDQAAAHCRAWLARVVRFLVTKAGVDQFLDGGCGLPVDENIHQIAHRYDPRAHVVYVDSDPMVQAYGRALLEDGEYSHFLSADVTRPADLLARGELGRHLDLDRPVGLLLCSTLHGVEDLATMRAILAEYVAALAPGSYVAITHQHDAADGGPLGELAGRMSAALGATIGGGTHRSRAEIESLFAGLELVKPGVRYLYEWWPEGPLLGEPSDACRLMLGGVGRKA